MMFARFEGGADSANLASGHVSTTDSVTTYSTRQYFSLPFKDHDGLDRLYILFGLLKQLLGHTEDGGIVYIKGKNEI